MSGLSEPADINVGDLRLHSEQRAVLKSRSSSSWELASCKLDRDKFIYFKFATCKFSTWIRFKSRLLTNNRVDDIFNFCGPPQNTVLPDSGLNVWRDLQFGALVGGGAVVLVVPELARVASAANIPEKVPADRLLATLVLGAASPHFETFFPVEDRSYRFIFNRSNLLKRLISSF
jgi:hypothetical protein